MHIWIRSEVRDFEKRVGLVPSDVRKLVSDGFKITIEESKNRVISSKYYKESGAEIVPSNNWQSAPNDAIIFGLKELPEEIKILKHRHIMFGHAYKGQLGSRALLDRFKKGGGTLYDLEYLLDTNNRRIAAFGYWAGFAGAAVALKVWLHQKISKRPGPKEIKVYSGRKKLVQELKATFENEIISKMPKPKVIIIGALGRVGSGASELAKSLNLEVTPWDIAETKHGGPFPQIFDHEIFINCILARPGVPVFVQKSDIKNSQKLSVISDISCDPDSPYNPIPIYENATSFSNPVIRTSHEKTNLDITAIDNLPSMLPFESSEDFSNQLLPTLLELKNIDKGPWGRAKQIYLGNI